MCWEFVPQIPKHKFLCWFWRLGHWNCRGWKRMKKQKSWTTSYQESSWKGCIFEHSACIAWCLQISVVDAFANSLGAHCRLPSSAHGLHNPLTWMWFLRNLEEEKLELVEKQVGLESIGARGTSKVLSFALVSGTIVYMHWRWHENCSWMVEHMFSLHPFGSCLANKEITYMFILH